VGGLGKEQGYGKGKEASHGTTSKEYWCAI